MADKRADLVLEGGGVKGIGLVGAVSALEDAGYTFPRVAGTSAGAIVGALLAARVPSTTLRALMGTLDYRRFADEGRVDRLGFPGKGASLFLEKGIYEGDELKDWLGEILAAHGVETFGDLLISKAEDPNTSLPPSRRFRLVVTAADLSRGQLVRLPWDYRSRYGLDPMKQRVVDAVRASMSIPFFYEPVRVRSAKTGGESYLVDGGLLSNFPVWIFDRTDGKAPRFPTFGIKLSARPDANQVPNEITGTVSYLSAMVGTMTSGHDRMHIDDPCVIRRTIFVDTFKVRATDFGITRATQARLFDSGRMYAERFLDRWSFRRYVRACRTN